MQTIIDNQRLHKQLQFILEIDKLKEIFRQSYLLDSQRRENSSEHSWHVAVLAMLLTEYSNEQLDLCRVLCMLLVHDLVEIDAGDTYCYDEQNALDKSEREKEAAERLFGFLPEDQGHLVSDLWEEFEAGATPEARFAHAVDRFMPLLHNFFTQGKSWQEHGITQDQVKARMAKVHQGSTALGQYAQKIIETAVQRGYLRPSRDSA